MIKVTIKDMTKRVTFESIKVDRDCAFICNKHCFIKLMDEYTGNFNALDLDTGILTKVNKNVKVVLADLEIISY